MLRALADTIESALRTLSAHKLRSFLTLLGIVIGILSVVAMVAVLEGLSKSISADLQSLGSGVFQVQKQPTFGNGDNEEWRKRKNFTAADVELLKNGCPSCERVAGENWDFSEVVSFGDEKLQGVSLIGGTVGVIENNGYVLKDGRVFNEGDVSRAANVAVLGADVADKLFPSGSGVGQELRIGTQSFQVIGTLESRGASTFGSRDNLVLVPLSRFTTLRGSKRSVQITVQARSAELESRAQDEVVAILRRVRGVAPEAENDFEIFTNESNQSTFNEIAGSIKTGTLLVCAISLLIGGIGVMNIMLVSVTERTSEVGLRRALGARRRRILLQFLVEAIVLCSLGGLAGLALGWGISELVKVFTGLPTEIPVWAIATAMSVSALVGLLAGLYPAYRASRLDPVEAMRQE